MEDGKNYVPNRVFVHKDCRGDYTNPLQKKAETKKNDNCVKPTVA